jgi:hypothetical protein
LQKPNRMDELSRALKRILSIDWANAWPRYWRQANS